MRISRTEDSEPPTVLIEARRGWRVLDWRELDGHGELLLFLIWRSIKSHYAQSALGVGWAVIQPVASMVVFTLVFGNLVGVQSDGQSYAVFAFAALVPWTYFANAVTHGTTSLTRFGQIISKIYFPRIIVPLSEVAARLVDFVIAFVILMILLPFFGKVPNAGIVVLPLLVVVMVAAAAGLALWLSALSIQYRDVTHAVGFGVQLLMYAAPVVYPASLVPASLQPFYALNPMVGVIEGFRAALLGTRAMPWDLIGIGAAAAVVLLVSGALFFRRREPVFADVA